MKGTLLFPNDAKVISTKSVITHNTSDFIPVTEEWKKISIRLFSFFFSHGVPL